MEELVPFYWKQSQLSLGTWSINSVCIILAVFVSFVSQCFILYSSILFWAWWDVCPVNEFRKLIRPQDMIIYIEIFLDLYSVWKYSLLKGKYQHCKLYSSSDRPWCSRRKVTSLEAVALLFVLFYYLWNCYLLKFIKIEPDVQDIIYLSSVS